MKKFYFLFVALSLLMNANAQIINFPDTELNSRLLSASSSNTISKDLNGNYFKIDANNNGAIEVSEALNVSYLDINSYSTYDNNGFPVYVNPIYDLKGLEEFKNIGYIDCSGNYLSVVIDFRQFLKLKTLIAKHCDLVYGDLLIDNMKSLEYIDIWANRMNNINLTGLTNLKVLKCLGNELVNLDVRALTNLEEIDCYSNALISLRVDGLIKLKKLICHYNNLSSIDLTGLDNLEVLNIRNNNFSNISILHLNKIIEFIADKNNFTSMDLHGLTTLKSVSLTENSLNNIDLSNTINLENLYCQNNQLGDINLTGLSNLKNLNVDYNKLTTLDIRGLSFLNSVNCKFNTISNFLSDKNNQFTYFYANDNLIEYLDLSTNKKIYTLSIDNNKLKNLNLKNGKIEGDLGFENNPDLQFICADEEQLETINGKISQYGYSNCHVNSYCTFRPGGDFYTVSGVNRFDADSNGCDLQDGLISNVKYKITKGSTEGYFVSNNSGNYRIDLQAGTYNVKPEIENNNYFTISPSELNFSFNQNSTPFTQDFCITPNGIHSDVEIFVLSADDARPGFDANYKIVYKNKGNQVENGSVNLTFDDSKMDFVSANTAPAQSTGSLIWNYTNLQPFETRIIDVVLNINSPMESPAVNGGDVLSYTAIITSWNIDELPNDNSFILNQTVVNSFDPNDITCLEGASVSTSKVGDYMHYMIRFENTGSANATNIVVKDLVDIAKYDVNSIIPINGSHDFYTRINGDKVEFIFENINLPFADATNDGYVSFKIKTKSTLVAGDTFSKNANIYFDYNFPIVTNTATTTIAALSNQDFEFKNYFTLYPNPVNNSLTIETKDAIEVSSINIYNTLGQMVLVVPNAQNVKTVDVSSLTSGNYFIKINSDKGTSNTKFVKN
ncbi:T9SS type A sorting domain-containing protein [Flavobacterium sp. H122]|uniref:DUF7619 domain-containing protein n=1 Tax=Flavobacterium sp. H122 TaxID=2529860 RepID=UPI0010AA424A|nr:T9SS type A sorting domain-containing protein [Flavobacterium sp. H122]